jgi:hypothetical protein
MSGLESTDLELFPEDDLDGIKPESREHSAAYLRERNPRLYKMIAASLGYGMPVVVIARDVGISENTVRAVAFAECKSVEAYKDSLLGNLRKSLHGAALRLAEGLALIPVDKLPAAIAAINQQVLLLEGNATAIVRHERGESLDDVERLIAEAQRQALESREVTGRVVEESTALPAIGYGLEKKAAENPAAPVAAAVVPVVAPAAVSVGIDGLEPSGKGSQPVDLQGMTGDHTVVYTTGGDAERGGEGVAPRAGGGSTLHH